MPQNPGQQRAADAVADELARRGWTNKDLSDATKDPDTDDPAVDGGTIGDFLAYKRWPKIGTLGRFEKALGWPAGSLRRLSLNGTPIPTDIEDSPTESVGDERQSAISQWLTRTESELTDEQVEELWDQVEPILEAVKQQALRKRRRGSRLGDT